MKIEDLISQFPKLYHVAQAGSWPNISDYGLLSTSAMLDLYGVKGQRRIDIESSHRPASIPLSKKGLPSAVVRDQKPMSDKGLRRALPARLSPRDWYEILNSKVFFWVSKERLHKLLTARAYAASSHDVLTVDTASLVAAHRQSIYLCPYNSGSTILRPVPRDESIFSRIEAYDIAHWRKRKRNKRDSVVELCVERGVPDIAEHVISVTEMKGERVLKTIFTR